VIGLAITVHLVEMGRAKGDPNRSKSRPSSSRCAFNLYLTFSKSWTRILKGESLFNEGTRKTAT
jgi:hypothetical protein